MAHVGDGPGSLGGFAGAIEDGEFVFPVRSTFDGAGRVGVAPTMASACSWVIAEFESAVGTVLFDLDHAAADQLLVLHQSEVRLDAGVAIHHEADGASGRDTVT